MTRIGVFLSLWLLDENSQQINEKENSQNDFIAQNGYSSKGKPKIFMIFFITNHETKILFIIWCIP
jgi:hypothetical protein